MRACPFYLILSLLVTAIQAQPAREIQISEGLSVIVLRDNLYQHVSDIAIESGKFKCNGLIYINNNEAIFCDTPTTIKFSEQLLQWFQKTHPDVKIKAIIVNHFHDDCLGGLKEFHRAGIKSYGHKLGPDLIKMKGDSFEMPQNLFSEVLEIKVGDSKIINFYPGEAHTRDNIITWIPEETAMFGGCMVKSMNAGKGNLVDANVKAWPTTIRKIKDKYPTASLIIPGHGDPGGHELLDYTIKLFE